MGLSPLQYSALEHASAYENTGRLHWLAWAAFPVIVVAIIAIIWWEFKRRRRRQPPLAINLVMTPKADPPPKPDTPPDNKNS